MILSICDDPVSCVALLVKSAADGCADAVSRVTVKLPESAEVLPASSMYMISMVLAPFV